MTPPIETPGEARTLVDDAVQKLGEAGVKVTGLVRGSLFGYTAREIITEAKNRDAGVVVDGLSRPR